MAIPTCHPEAPYDHAGHGLCNTCYMRWRRTKGARKATCHPDRPNYARGLCNPCYQRASDTDDSRARRVASARLRRLDRNEANRLEQAERRRARKRNRARDGAPPNDGETRTGPCEICGQHRNQLHFDHDHATGEFRGWLCRTCNIGIGHLKDDVKIMQAAISYLTRAR